MPTESVLRIDPTGDITCLYTEALDLADLGTVTIRRASLVEWNGTLRAWTVTLPDGTFLAGPFVSRSQAVAFEISYWNERL